MERTPWKFSHGTSTMEVTSWFSHHGSLQVQRAQWKLPHLTNIKEVT